MNAKTAQLDKIYFLWYNFTSFCATLGLSTVWSFFVYTRKGGDAQWFQFSTEGGVKKS